MINLKKSRGRSATAFLTVKGIAYRMVTRENQRTVSNKNGIII